MSSIYRKGRDGYFYYQTYVRNPKTGKKDKKIFHSLSTKDRSLAKEKQIEYDNKYSKSNETINFSFLVIILKKYRFVLYLVFISTIYLSFQKLLNQGKKSLNTDSYVVYDNNSDLIEPSGRKTKIGLVKKKESNYQVSADTNNLKVEQISEKGNKSINIESKSIDTKKYNYDKDQNVDSLNIIIPKYDLHKFEAINNSYQQVQINLTIDGEYNNSGLIKICNEVREKYKKYESIIICIYSNTTLGRSIAEGLNSESSERSKNSPWLAMYSFNPIEGEYFDDNPGRYQNIFSEKYED